MRLKGKVFEELGKTFFNLSLLLIGTVVVQPFASGKLSLTLAFWGIFGFFLFIGLGIFLIDYGERLKEKEEPKEE